MENQYGAQEPTEARTKLESDQCYRDLMNHHFPGYLEIKEQKAARRKKMRPFWISASCAAVAAFFVLSLVLLWPLMFSADTDNPKKNYLIENETEVLSDIIELNDDIRGIKIQIDILYNTQLTRHYDRISNDTLYYTAKLTNEDETFETINYYLFINPDYIITKELTEEKETTTVSVFLLEYSKVVVDEGWAYTITYHAFARYNDITIYIEYEQLSFDENSNFLNFFEQTFRVA